MDKGGNQMRKLILIGGGEVGRGRTSYQTAAIDQEAVKMTNKSNPNFLFIGLASSFSDSYYDTMKKIYKDLGCNCVYLKKKNILNNLDLAKSKINQADIIYICGGDTIKLLKDVKDYNIDILLKKACEEGKVLVGMSAGAILLANKGFSDSLIIRKESNEHVFLNGINLVNINICPHYKTSKQKDKELANYLLEFNEDCFCLEDCTALKIVDDIYEVIKSESNKKAYYSFIENKELKSTELITGTLQENN